MEYFVSEDQRSYSLILFRFGYLISGPTSYRDFGETDTRPQVAFSPLTFNSPSFGEYSFVAPW